MKLDYLLLLEILDVPVGLGQLFIHKDYISRREWHLIRRLKWRSQKVAWYAGMYGIYAFIYLDEDFFYNIRNF